MANGHSRGAMRRSDPGFDRIRRLGPTGVGSPQRVPRSADGPTHRFPHLPWTGFDGNGLCWATAKVARGNATTVEVCPGWRITVHQQMVFPWPAICSSTPPPAGCHGAPPARLKGPRSPMFHEVGAWFCGAGPRLAVQHRFTGRDGNEGHGGACRPVLAEIPRGCGVEVLPRLLWLSPWRNYSKHHPLNTVQLDGVQVGPVQE